MAHIPVWTHNQICLFLFFFFVKGLRGSRCFFFFLLVLLFRHRQKTRPGGGVERYLWQPF